MLLRFAVGGYMSFNEKEEFYMAAPVGARLKSTRYEDNFHLKRKFRPAKSALVFGDNATGKTNFFYSVSRCCNIINNGLGNIDEDDFNRNADCVEFEISVLTNKEDVFDFALKYNKEGIILYESLAKNDKEIYSFVDEKLILKDNLKDKEAIERIFSKTSTNTLLLKLRDVMPGRIICDIEDFIATIRKIDTVIEEPISTEVKWFPMMSFYVEEKELIESKKDVVISILNSLDKTVDDFDFRELKKGNPAESKYEMRIYRGEEIFDIHCESLGIKKMIKLIVTILGIYNGETVIVDELDSSIGSRALIEIINGVINSEDNIDGQFILSTHNLALLDFDIFADSQMYVVNKNAKLETTLTPISEFDYRAEKKRLDELYLKGMLA